MLTAVKNKIINNPDFKTLREMAKADETPVSYGAAAYVTKKAASRSSSCTKYSRSVPLGSGQLGVEPEEMEKIGELVQRLAAGMEMIQIDRVIGKNYKKTWHCRLLIPRQYARIPLLWAQTLFEASAEQKDPAAKPDFLTIDLPQWPEAFPGMDTLGIGSRGIFIDAKKGHTYILGTDYVGEVKMSFLRQALYQMKQLGGLGLHAGSKALHLKNASGKVEEVGLLLLGLSGTGKTTLTLDNHGLSGEEKNELLQDDIAWLCEDGSALGTEDNFYVKTEGVSAKDQPEIYNALQDPATVFENVPVNKQTGLPELDNYAHGTNGRALAFRSKIKGSSSRINLEKAHKIIFITRRDTVVPPVARLTPEQAANFFMLGESIETSAGDPARAGQPKHEVGFNPFIIGPEKEEGLRLMDLVKRGKLEGYLLNTGSLGKGGIQAQGAGKKIGKEISSRIILEIARGGISWEKDPDWGYETATAVAGIKNWEDYRPQNYYTPEEYRKLTEALKKERLEFLEKFGFSLA